MADRAQEETMRAVAGGLDRIFNGDATGEDRKVGFVLLTFNMNEIVEGEGRANYVSNGAERDDMIVLFKELIARFEGQAEVSGHG